MGLFALGGSADVCIGAFRDRFLRERWWYVTTKTSDRNTCSAFARTLKVCNAACLDGQHCFSSRTGGGEVYALFGAGSPPGVLKGYLRRWRMMQLAWNRIAARNT